MATTTLRVQLPEEKARKVREQAMKRFGYSKGAISKALNVALDEWLGKAKPAKPPITAKDLLGRLSGVKESSVELQHKARDY